MRLLEATFVALLSVLGGIAFGLLRPGPRGPIGYWASAVGAIFCAGIGNALVPTFAWALVLEEALGVLYPALLLAGTLAFAGRAVPAWLVPGAVALGALRAVVALSGTPSLADGLGLLAEPTATLAAAWFAYTATRGRSVSAPQRALAPALGLAAALQAASLVATAPGAPIPVFVLGAWALGVPLLLAIQIAAAGDRAQEELRRAHEELEQRVQERTAELLESEERYRTVSELSNDYAFAFCLRPDGRIRFEWVTAAVTRVTGYGAEEFEANRWLQIIHPGDREVAMASMRRVLSGSPESQELRIRARDGGVRWLSVRMAVRRHEPDGSALVVGAASNVTERKRAERERRRLEQHMQEVQRLESLGVLAGGIAHDFNNLLTVIGGNLRLAADDLPEDHPARERLEHVRAAAEHAQGLTRQMLTYSGKASLTLRPVDVSSLCRDMLDLLRASVSKKARLDVDLCEGLPPVEGDETQIRQVLLNLVTNASEALGDESGAIRVHTDALRREAADLRVGFGTPDPEPGEYVLLEVADTGCGISEAQRARVFEPFFTSKASGRGLGLAAVLGIVRAHRGLIQVESERDRGTTFRVWIPAAAHRSAVAPAPPARRAGARAGGTVLVVDDDPGVLEVAHEFLRRAGFRVRTATGGRAAIERVRAGDDVDAVVLDLVMPEVDGEETFEALRQARPDLPIVLVSGYDKEMTAARFLGRGIAGFVYKPYEPDELVECVRAALEG